MDWRKQNIDDEMNCPVPAKLAKLSCPINDLADEDLAAIFQRLPPYERLIVSEVCRRWRDISRKSWLDVKTLDLSRIPGKHVAAVIKQCPNLQDVFGVRKWFGLNELVGLSKIPSLSRVRFYDCEFSVDEFASDVFSAIFSENLRHTAWTELVMHDATFVVHEKEFDNAEREFDDYESDQNECRLDLVADALPASLTRLQLSGLRSFDRVSLNRYSFLHGLERLENLECLILHNTPDPDPCSFSSDGDPEPTIGEALDECGVFAKICCLKNLKELCLGPIARIFEDVETGRSLADLPKLAVLFLHDVNGDDIADGLTKFLGSNPTLRTLVLTGSFATNQPITLRARKRLDGEENLPPLRIFTGKEAQENIRFANNLTSNPAIIAHSVDVPMPEFLEREDTVPIFDGVWVAEKMKEIAENGGKLWDYGPDFRDISFDFLNE